MANLLLFAVFLVIDAALPEFYHSTDEILETLLNLECAFLKQVETEYVHAFYLESKSPHKAFLLFGEHPRELISVELAFYLIKEICKGNSDILIHTQLMIVVNALPDSRKRVEKGEFCLRTNRNRVNINRNWDYNWEYESCISDRSQNCPGTAPFSEVETLEVKTLLTTFSPDIFLTVHSGMASMLYPYASSYKKIDSKIESEFQFILSKINEDLSLHLEIGQGSYILGSLIEGNCLDYAFEILKIQHSYCFEIYSESTSKSFLHINDKAYVYLDDNEPCLSYFNPLTLSLFESTLISWKSAIEELVALILLK